jgi:hypothetical protein
VTLSAAAVEEDPYASYAAPLEGFESCRYGLPHPDAWYCLDVLRSGRQMAAEIALHVCSMAVNRYCQLASPSTAHHHANDPSTYYTEVHGIQLLVSRNTALPSHVSVQQALAEAHLLLCA